LIEIHNWGFASEKTPSGVAKALFRFFLQAWGFNAAQMPKKIKTQVFT
jgi:hypothetical protein